MNRNQLANELAEKLEITRREAVEFLAALQDLITETVAAGEAVALSGFAKFYRRESKARMGRNPATGEAIKIPAKKAAKIVPLKGFKDAVLTGKAPRKPAKKAAAKKAPAKRAPAKKAPAKRAPAKKAAAKKAPARKTARR